MLRYQNTDSNQQKTKIAKAVNRNLNRLTTFVIRTALVTQQFAPSKFEQRFADFAKEISSSESVSDEKFINFLMDCDASANRNSPVLIDDNFQQFLSECKLVGTPKIVTLMTGINREKQPDSAVLTESGYQVEHILPKSSIHWKEWKGFEDGTHDEWVDKIGNLTLQGSGPNYSDLNFNSTFDNKKTGFQKSAFAITRAICEVEEWSPSTIKKRQHEIAKTAVRVWKFK